MVLLRKVTGCRANATTPGRLVVRSLKWRRGVLTLIVTGLSTGERLQAQLYYAHHAPRRIVVGSRKTRVHTIRPGRVVLRVMVGDHPRGKALTAYVR
jgi:hypothetical protein